MSGFLAVCYHYIRPAAGDPFPRLLGTREDAFRRQVEELQKAFQVISLSEAIAFVRRNVSFSAGKPGLLFTFDDGLSDHYRVAKILADYGIKATFFIPTSILTDKLPISPVIIHYSLANYGVDAFLRAYEEALVEHGINVDDFRIAFTRGIDDPMKTISNIKSVFKYRLHPDVSRRVILSIYRNLLEKDFPNALQIMHLNREHIKDMLDMGHSIGSHTHSHPSIAGAALSDEDFRKEVIYSKEYLERAFKTSVDAFSYPFGEKQDYTGSDERVRDCGAYELAFTVDRFLNTARVSRSRLGRYSVYSTDSAEKLLNDLRALAHL